MSRVPKAIVAQESPSASREIDAADLEESPQAFRRLLVAWYRKHARDLPWRGVDDPYSTWLSEIMLQQTRVATVIDRYREFLLRFPTLPSLAAAQEADVLALWSGLGYYRRARMLHRGAQFVVRELGGKLPETATELRTLPGVGEYTAAAIASIAFGESIAVLDGNVERVLLRILGLPEDRSSRTRSRLAAVAQLLMPPRARRPRRSNPPGDQNQAMMELGATLCLPKAPLCLQCPVIAFCRTRGEHPTAARARQQSRTVAHLLCVRKRGTSTEVLLTRRSPEAALMPGMLELPPLPLDAVAHREPVMRLRHSITNTNYYVQIFAESAPGVEPHSQGQYATMHPPATSDEPTEAASRLFELDPEDQPFVADAKAATSSEPGLLEVIPAAEADLEWVAISKLLQLPLTGLARKTLQRLGVMPLPVVHIE